MEFSALTVFVLANNETELLRTTINAIKSNCKFEDLEKIVIVAKSKKCLSYHVALDIVSSDSQIELYVQKSQTAQLCLYELPPMVTTSHFVIMAADMEMDPASLSTFISKAKEHPNRIICAAKWLKGSTVTGYGLIHEFFSRTMNRIISVLFCKNVYDPFSIYQIYPFDLYKRMGFDNPKTFLYEYTLKPLSLGEEYEEIPTVYNKRKSGKSNFNFLTLCGVAIRFLFTGLKTRVKLWV